VTEAAETVASTAVSSVVASLAVTEGADTASSTATVVWPPVSANLGVTEGADTTSSLVLVTTPTSLYFTDAAPGQSPTAGDKATNLPLFYNSVTPGANNEGTWDTVAPNNSNIVNRTIYLITEVAGSQSYYFGRFSSLPLAAQTIPAQNWNYAATVGSQTTQVFTYFWPVMYVWRPSNNSIVGYIFDASAQVGVKWPAALTQQNQNFAGASVTTQAGDILVVEAWGAGGTGGLNPDYQSWNINSSTSKIVSPYPIQFSGAPITANSVLAEGSDTVSSGATVSAPVANVTATDVAETLSATVKVSVSASLTVTEATDTVLGIESTAVVASLAVTEAQDTLSSSVSVTSPGLNASLVATEANDAVSASAVTAIGGSLARTEANDSLSASASSPVTGNLAKQEGDDYTSSIARTTAGAGLGVQEVNDTVTSSVSVVTGFTANLTSQEGPDQLASSATVAMVTIIANASMVEGADFTYGYAVKPKKRVILVT
jgi:hypothetical protein